MVRWLALCKANGWQCLIWSFTTMYSVAQRNVGWRAKAKQCNVTWWHIGSERTEFGISQSSSKLKCNFCKLYNLWAKWNFLFKGVIIIGSLLFLMSLIHRSHYWVECHTRTLNECGKTSASEFTLGQNVKPKLISKPCKSWWHDMKYAKEQSGPSEADRHIQSAKLHCKWWSENNN